MTQPQSGWGQGWGPGPRPGPRPGPATLKGSRPIALYVVGLIVVAVVAVVLINVLTPPPPPPRCPPGQTACNPPPPVPRSSATPPPVVGLATPAPTAPGGPTSSAPPFVAFEPWSSSDGWGFHYYRAFSVTSTDQRTFADLAGSNYFDGVSVRVESQRSSASELIKKLRDAMGPPTYESIAVDDDDRDAILQPFLGLRAGSAVILRGSTGEGGAVRPVAIVIVAAADGDLAIGIRVVIPRPDVFSDPQCNPKTDDCERRFRSLGEALDSVAKRISWPDQP